VVHDLAKLLSVIYEDSELLVVNKPAGLVCHPTKGDEYSSLISRLRLYVGPGKKVHLVNRLDRETSGVTLAALDESAARRLRKLWEARDVQKEYLAIVHGHVREDAGTIDAPLGKDERSQVAIRDCVRADGVAAVTDFAVEERFVTSLGLFTLLRVQPRTGRKHQIRIHLAHLGHPIVGDKIYGGDEGMYLALVEDRLTAEHKQKLIVPCHALHAISVTFAWHGGPKTFQAPPKESFLSWLTGNPARRTRTT
jgi:23S rRNA pseudouridine1911/1915/1917 synthase